MSIFREFFTKEKPIFTGITRGVGGFGFGASAGGDGGDTGPLSLSGGSVNPSGLEPGNGYTYHTFTSPGTLTATGSGDVELFLIGGGGASGGGAGGGGGAGAVIYRTSVPVTAGSYPIVVGDGGTGTYDAGYTGADQPVPHAWFTPGLMIGQDSTALGFTADGGGYGGGNGPPPNSGQPWYPARVGGSGGGQYAGPGQSGNDPGPSNAPGTGASGHPGGNNVESPPVGWGNPGAPDGSEGGNGGGGSRNTNPDPKNGGQATQYPNFAGPIIGVPTIGPSNGPYAGGGGGGYSSQFGPNTAGSGGGGGAGNGAGGPNPAQGGQGAANTGSGAGGSGHGPGSGTGGKNGGSGICVIRYQK